MVQAFKSNWNTYLMEAFCLGTFMVSASLFGTLLEHPDSPANQLIGSASVRLLLMAIAMGVTATLIIYSPMGKLSGAHMNPAVSLTFFTLGKMKWEDMLFYCLFQCAGGLFAVYLMHGLLGRYFEDAHVNFVITAPGKNGALVAFIVEVVIAFFMLMMVLFTSNHKKLSPYTGMIAGLFVMGYVYITAPVSGFSMNPARTLASAIPANQYPSLWVYLSAPFIGMLTAARVYRYFNGVVICAKYHHSFSYSCIFNCGYCKHESPSDDAMVSKKS